MQVQTASAAAQNPVSVKSAVSPRACKMPKTGRVVKQLNRVNLRTFIARQHGKFVSVSYLKLNGEPRVLTGRLGVTAYLNGGQNKVEADDRPYLTMFDVKLRQYRTVNLDSVAQLRARGLVWQIVD